MTSKLSFRSRALDASKPMPVYRAEEVPDLPDFAAINRGVPPLPSGMEKEEECEHHLQRAMSAQQAFGHTGELVIPTPDVYTAPNIDYGELYRADYVMPRQLIHMQLFAIEQDYPDYDMDSEDEEWLQKTNKIYPDLTPDKFEQMIDKLEKSSFSNVIQLPEAKALYQHEDEPLVDEVYDYWLGKRLRTLAPLLPAVKLEKREGAPSNNPYVAFRRRIEKMQTRKNRKNDESSYERMLKLRRDLNRAVNLLDMVKKREKMKREQLSLTVDLFKKRYEIGDFTGQILAEVSAQARPSCHNNYHNHHHHNHHHNNIPSAAYGPATDQSRASSKSMDANYHNRKKREYRKRQHQTNRTNLNHHRNRQSTLGANIDMDYGNSSDEDVFRPSHDHNMITESTIASDDDHLKQDQQHQQDGYFTFRRKKGCYYHAPRTDLIGNWPWCSPNDGGLGLEKYRYCLTYLGPSPSTPPSAVSTTTNSNNSGLRCIGLARRRIGRGGRIIYDRAHSPNYEDEDDHQEFMQILHTTHIANKSNHNDHEMSDADENENARVVDIECQVGDCINDYRT